MLSVEKDARRVCTVNMCGNISYDPDYVGQNGLEDILEQVRMIARGTNTYMRQMEQAPPLLAERLTGDYRLLAEFNDTVLAGHQTQYGLEFITWSRAHDRSLEQGHYYDTFHGADAYTAAKQDFAVRSGLLPASRLFTQEQLAVIYDAAQNMTVQGHISNPEQEKLLAQIMEQIEYDYIATPSNREQIEEFVELMLEVALTRSPTIRIGREQEYPAALVQQRFERLERTHIEKVLDGISENTTRVRNARAYLLAALFNAPSSTGNYYTMLVNHDLYSG